MLVQERTPETPRSRPSQRVLQHRDEIRSLVAQHHACNPRLFGSAARGEDRPGSDVDLVVDFDHDASLLDELGLRLALTDLLQTDVDVVGSDAIRGNMRDRILDEAVPV